MAAEPCQREPTDYSAVLRAVSSYSIGAPSRRRPGYASSSLLPENVPLFVTEAPPPSHPHNRPYAGIHSVERHVSGVPNTRRPEPVALTAGHSHAREDILDLLPGRLGDVHNTESVERGELARDPCWVRQ